MAIPTYSGQFSQLFLGNAAGVLVELSIYSPKFEIKADSEDQNLTVFNAGGNPVTETHRRGARVADLKIDFLGNATLKRILRQIIAARSGTDLVGKFGTNNIPNVGDSVFRGTFTLFSIVETYNTHANWTIQCDMKPSDGGTVAPTWGTF